MAPFDAVTRRLLRLSYGAIFLVSTLMYGVQPSQALEPYKVFRGVLVLEGKFVAGDFNRLHDFLSNKSNFEKISGGVFLASPGGNIAEAMKIGSLIRALRLTTDAPSGPPTGVSRFGESVIGPRQLTDPRHNYLCASACFFVYVAGVYRNLNWTGRLGIHRPSLSEDSQETLSVERALDITWRVRAALTMYLKHMDVPDKYIDLMYSVPPKDVHWITQREYDTDFRGYIPELRNRLDAECNAPTNPKKTATAATKLTQKGMPAPMTQPDPRRNSAPADPSPDDANCWLREREKLSNHAWQRLFGPS
jgi:hypothetical protein